MENKMIFFVCTTQTWKQSDKVSEWVSEWKSGIGSGEYKLNYFMIPFIFTPHKFDGHKADQDNRVLYSTMCVRVPYKCWNKLLCNYLCRLTWKRLHSNGVNVQQHHFNKYENIFFLIKKVQQWTQRFIMSINTNRIGFRSFFSREWILFSVIIYK